MGVVSGARRMAASPLAIGASPSSTSRSGVRSRWVSADGQLVISFNGEIYNYRALCKQLERKGYLFRSHSDTEVLLYLYAEKGEAMLEELRGMYALALWDGRKRGLLLARDPLGIKPLYYADDGATLQVASQVKALLKGGRVDTTPEPAGHVGFFLWGHVPEPYTFYKGIRALPAGSTLWVDATGLHQLNHFFSLTDELTRASETALIFRHEEMQERLRTALTDSVRHHLIADVPVGVFLSSGLDSTTLTALTAEIGGSLRTVTLGFSEYQGTENDETPLAELVAKHYGASHQTRWVTRKDFQSESQNLLEAMDQPTIDGVNSYFVSRAAASTGLKVALSGLGGDELLGGYPSFRQIPRVVRILRPFRALPHWEGGSGISLLLFSSISPRPSMPGSWNTGAAMAVPTCCGGGCSCRGSYLSYSMANW
jgi:asparagine synthase (glutamine-hydrolysing)